MRGFDGSGDWVRNEGRRSFRTSAQIEPMTTGPKEADISARATMIARGLLVTKRAVGVIAMEGGNLRLKCRTGGYYWIAPDGHQVLRGELLSRADELQPKFIDAMERAGR